MKKQSRRQDFQSLGLDFQSAGLKFQSAELEMLSAGDGEGVGGGGGLFRFFTRPVVAVPTETVGEDVGFVGDVD